VSLVSARASSSAVWDQSCFLRRPEIEARQLARLQQLLAYCYEHVPMYRRLYDEAGFKPADVRSLDDFKRLVPRLDKPELMADQRDSGVALRNDLPIGTAGYYHQTSGTTGDPLEEWSTTYDMMTVGDSWISTWWAAGMRPSDLMYFCFNFGTFAGFWTAFYAAQRMSCTIASGAGLSTQQRLAQMAKLRPATVVATPTYLLRMIEEAREIGVDLAGLGVRFAVTAGEPATAGARRKIIEGFGLEAFCDQYGISDAMWGTVECPTDSGGIHVFEPAFYSYSIDGDGHPIDEDGVVGENVITAFNRALQPIVNYRTHDLVRRFSTHDHGCGWNWQWLDGVVLGRTDFMLTIRGTNVYPTAVDNLLAQIGELSPSYEMHISTDRGMDTLLIKAETSLLQADPAALAERVQGHLRQHLMVDVGVEIVPPDTLPRYELKTKRIFDHRKD
jgi:phenylacetate-CoA ligase